MQKNAFERLFGMIPSGKSLVLLNEVALLVKDAFQRWPSFAGVLYCNLDYDILILNILMFNMFAVAIGNSIVGIFLAFIVEKVLKRFRAFFGEMNLAKKTLTDERFLL